MLIALKILTSNRVKCADTHPVPLFPSCCFSKYLSSAHWSKSNLPLKAAAAPLTVLRIVQEHSVHPLSQRKPSQLNRQRSQGARYLWNRDTRLTWPPLDFVYPKISKTFLELTGQTLPWQRGRICLLPSWQKRAVINWYQIYRSAFKVGNMW